MLLLCCCSSSPSFPLSSFPVSAHCTPRPTACSSLSAKRESLEQPGLQYGCTNTFTHGQRDTHVHIQYITGAIGPIKQGNSGMLMLEMCSKYRLFAEPSSHTETTAQAQTHSQPESISVHNAHSLDELTSLVTSIDTGHTLIYHILPSYLCVVVGGCCLFCKKERKKEVELFS